MIWSQIYSNLNTPYLPLYPDFGNLTYLLYFIKILDHYKRCWYKRVQLYVEFRDLQRWVSYRRYDKTCHIHSYFYTGIIFSLLFACTYHEIIRKGMNRKLFNNRHFVSTHTHANTHLPLTFKRWRWFCWSLLVVHVRTFIQWNRIENYTSNSEMKGSFSEIAGNEYKLHPLNLHNSVDLI